MASRIDLKRVYLPGVWRVVPGVGLTGYLEMTVIRFGDRPAIPLLAPVGAVPDDFETLHAGRNGSEASAIRVLRKAKCQAQYCVAPRIRAARDCVIG